MASVGKVTVPVTLELADASPALRALIRELVREELETILKKELAKPATMQMIDEYIRLREGE